MNDLKTTKELFDTTQIEKNTKALQELEKALLAYQETLNSSKNTNILGLDNLKEITTTIDTLVTITNKLKTLGAEGLGLTNYVTYHSLQVPFYKVV